MPSPPSPLNQPEKSKLAEENGQAAQPEQPEQPDALSAPHHSHVLPGIIFGCLAGTLILVFSHYPSTLIAGLPCFIFALMLVFTPKFRHPLAPTGHPSSSPSRLGHEHFLACVLSCLLIAGIFFLACQVALGRI